MTTTFTTLENLATVKESIGTPKRYGFIIDQSITNSTDCVSYIYDAYGMTPAGLDANNEFQYGSWKDFCDDINYPVMLAADGTELYRLDPEDQTKRIDGEAVDYTDGNMMAAFKRLWLSITQDGSKIKVVFCTERLDPTYQAEAFYNEYGELKDVIYHSMFNGTLVDGVVRSIPGEAAYYLDSSNNMLAACKANGEGWEFPSYSFHTFICMLHVLLCKSLLVPKFFGRGHVSVSSIINTKGATISTGRFSGTVADTVSPVKSFYMEDYWGTRSRFILGYIYNKDNFIYVKTRKPYLRAGVNQGYFKLLEETFSEGTNFKEGGLKCKVVVSGILLDDHTKSTSYSYSSEQGYAAYYYIPNLSSASSYLRLGAVGGGVGIDSNVWSMALDTTGTTDRTCRLAYT